MDFLAAYVAAPGEYMTNCSTRKEQTHHLPGLPSPAFGDRGPVPELHHSTWDHSFFNRHHSLRQTRQNRRPELSKDKRSQPEHKANASPKSESEATSSTRIRMATIPVSTRISRRPISQLHPDQIVPTASLRASARLLTTVFPQSHQH